MVLAVPWTWLNAVYVVWDKHGSQEQKVNLTLKKETEDTRRRKHTPWLWIDRINSVKMVISCKLIYRIDCNHYQISNRTLHRYRKAAQKSPWKHKRSQIAKVLWKRKMMEELKKKLIVLQIILQGSLLYYRSIITKLHAAGPSAHGGQWNRVGAEKRPQ